jgi:hypothetical protein
MTFKSKLGTFLLVALMTSTSVATLSYANTDAKPAYATQTQMLRLSEEARTAIMSAQTARLDLFNNNPEGAKAAVDRGIGALEAAQATMKSVVIPGTDAADAKAEYLPFDSKMSLAETFTVTPEKEAALGKARGMFEANAPEKAIDVLREAAVDVMVSTALLPGEATLTELRNAQKLISEGKFHEANVALKSVEDSVIVRVFGIDAIPVQGMAG